MSEPENEGRSVAVGARGWSSVAWLLLLGLTGRLVWRAGNQAVTNDEAITFMTWIDAPWSSFTTVYYANNHVLFSALSKLSVSAFGPSLLAFRLPAIIAGFIFFWLCLRLCRSRERMGASGFVGFAVLTTNPLILDFFCCARGYGPALTALLGSLMLMAGTLVEGRRRPGRLVLCGAALALVPLFNLSFAFSGLALGLVFSWAWIRRRRTDGEKASRACLDAAAYCVTPALMIVAAGLVPVLRTANSSLFYFGSPRWGVTVDALAALSLRHTDIDDVPEAPREFLGEMAQEWGPGLILFLVGAAVLIAAYTAAGFVRAKTMGSHWDIGRTVMLLAGGAFFGSMMLHSGAAQAGDYFDALENLPLPHKRTALHLVLLANVAVVMAWCMAWRARSAGRLVAGTLAIPLLAILVFQVANLRASHYAEWVWDAGSRRVYEALSERRQSDRPLRVASLTTLYSASLNFYRNLEGATWLDPVDRTLVRPALDYDYLLVTRYALAHPPLANFLDHVVYRDEDSGCCIIVLKRE